MHEDAPDTPDWTQQVFYLPVVSSLPQFHISSIPLATATDGESYQYDVVASHPDPNASFTYALTSIEGQAPPANPSVTCV